MLGYVALTGERGWKTLMKQDKVLDLPLMQVLMPGVEGRHEKRLERRIDRAARRLREMGVRRVLTGPAFPYWDRLERQGLRGVDPRDHVPGHGRGAGADGVGAGRVPT